MVEGDVRGHRKANPGDPATRQHVHARPNTRNDNFAQPNRQRDPLKPEREFRDENGIRDHYFVYEYVFP